MVAEPYGTISDLSPRKSSIKTMSERVLRAHHRHYFIAKKWPLPKTFWAHCGPNKKGGHCAPPYAWSA